MSRIAKIPIIIPNDVRIKINNQNILIQGNNGQLSYNIHKDINIQYIYNKLIVTPQNNNNNWSLAGTTRALLNNMVFGVTNGFSKKLLLVGIGYRVTIKDNIIILALGFSHLIYHKLPIGIVATSVNQNEITLTGVDKQLVGQLAADIRAYRSPEIYKGKGIRYAEEIIRIKETKKK